MSDQSYTIRFDLDHVAMFRSGLLGPDINRVYWQYIPKIIEETGFTIHHHESIYHASGGTDRIAALMAVKGSPDHAVSQFIRRIHVNWMD